MSRQDRAAPFWEQPGGTSYGAAFKKQWYIFDPNEGMFSYDETPFVTDLKKLMDHYKTYKVRLFELTPVACRQPGCFRMPRRS